MTPIYVCPKCGRSHGGPYLKGSNASYEFGELCHKKVDCPRNRGKVRGANAVQLGRLSSLRGSINLVL